RLARYFMIRRSDSPPGSSCANRQAARQRYANTTRRCMMHARRRMPGRNCKIGLVFIVSVDLPLLLLPFFTDATDGFPFLSKRMVTSLVRRQSFSRFGP